MSVIDAASSIAVVPAHAGIHVVQLFNSWRNQDGALDSGVRRNDAWVIDFPFDVLG